MNHSNKAGHSKSDTYYVVPMFPYPSGKLHMGHARNYAIADAYARHARSVGKHVLFPMGWDSFGLPAEKAALSFGVDPKEWTQKNIVQMREQLMEMDFSFDWNCELATHEPAYYMHTQRIFIDLVKAGLVYKKKAQVWWDPVDQTVLANEQVVDGCGWRSGAVAQKRSMDMYWIKTTKYAQEMAQHELVWSHGAKADHLAWLGPEAAEGKLHLHDWCVSRQRKWGTPVPMVECGACGSVPMNKEQLPFSHQQMGQSCACPSCGQAATSSEETLDTFFDSAWYFLRYPENHEKTPQAKEVPFSKDSAHWTPVDLYVGGREHATMHLVYARFMARALEDMGYASPREPFVRYMAQGMVKSRAYSQGSGANEKWCVPSTVSKGADGTLVDPDGNPVYDRGVQKMSKSKLNGIDPADVIRTWGLDAMRLFLFFAAPFESDMEWDEQALSGCQRFTKKFETLAHQIQSIRNQVSVDRIDSKSPQAQEFEAEQLRFNQFAVSQYERHDGLNSLVAAIMKRCNEISASFENTSTNQLRLAFLDVCCALSPLAPALAQRAAYTVDRTWTANWNTARIQKGESTSENVSFLIDGKFYARVQVQKGMTAQEAFTCGMEHSVEFMQKVQKEGITWEQAIWAPGRALNARSPKSIKPKPNKM